MLKHLSIGDTISIQQGIEQPTQKGRPRQVTVVHEYIVTGRDGDVLCGKPTTDTKRIFGMKRNATRNDIEIATVTHINRVPVRRIIKNS